GAKAEPGADRCPDRVLGAARAASCSRALRRPGSTAVTKGTGASRSGRPYGEVRGRARSLARCVSAPIVPVRPIAHHPSLSDAVRWTDRPGVGPRLPAAGFTL